MFELSFCSSNTGIQVGEQLHKVSVERLNVRETCSEGKVPALNPGNASTASFACPAHLLKLQQFPKATRIQLHISYLLHTHTDTQSYEKKKKNNYDFLYDSHFIG